MMAQRTVLVVDDDKFITDLLKNCLAQEHYEVVTAWSAQSMQSTMQVCKPDIVLLDLSLPDMDGAQVIPLIRRSSQVPILMMSGHDELARKVACLEMGADDFLTKPFQISELSARIKVQLRRRDHRHNETGSKVRFDRWVLDRSQFQAFSDDNRSAGLTIKEYRLLEALISSPHRVMTREQIIDQVRKEDYNITDRAIDTQIARIRRKLGDDGHCPRIIKSVRGLGYKLAMDVSTT